MSASVRRSAIERAAQPLPRRRSPSFDACRTTTPATTGDLRQDVLRTRSDPSRRLGLRAAVGRSDDLSFDRCAARQRGEGGGARSPCGLGASALASPRLPLVRGEFERGLIPRRSPLNALGAGLLIPPFGGPASVVHSVGRHWLCRCPPLDPASHVGLSNELRRCGATGARNSSFKRTDKAGRSVCAGRVS